MSEERNELNLVTGSECECPECQGFGQVKGSNGYEWETYLERCETCLGEGYVEDKNK